MRAKLRAAGGRRGGGGRRRGRGMGSRVRGFEFTSSSPPAQPEPSTNSSDGCAGVTGAHRGEAAGAGPIFGVRAEGPAGRRAGEGCDCAASAAGGCANARWVGARMGLTDRSVSSCERYRLLCALASCREWPGTLQRAPFAAAPHQQTRGRRRAARPIACTTAPYRLPTRPTVSDAR